MKDGPGRKLIMSESNPVSKNEKTCSNAAVKLAVLCMAFYAVTYICRKSFDSNINEIMAFFGKDKPTVGLIGTFFFVAYAAGQVVHGMLCKYYRPRPVVFTMGLIVAGMNLLMGLVPKEGFRYLKFIWLVNGFACASFWSLLILTLNQSVAKKHKAMVVFAACFPVSTGTFLAYGVSALLSFLRQFRYSFFFGCGAMMIMCAVWLIYSKPLINACKAERDACDGAENSAKDPGKPKAARSGWTKEFIALFAVLAFFSIANNLIRDGVNTWTPTILGETYQMKNWLSVLLSVAVPLMSVFGGLISIRLQKRLGSCASGNAVLFGACCITLCALMLMLRFGLWITTLLCLILVSLLMSAVNNINTSIFPMSCENVNAGTVAGVIDGFCYVGSAISSYCLGALSQKTGSWDTVFRLFILLSFLCIAVGFAYGAVRRRHEGRQELR